MQSIMAYYATSSAINKSPFMALYNTKDSNIEGLQIFGQLGHCPNLKQKPKLNPRAWLVQYLHRIPTHRILVELQDGSTQRIRIKDVKPYQLETDPKDITLDQLHTFPNTRFDVQDYKSHDKIAATQPCITHCRPDGWESGL